MELERTYERFRTTNWSQIQNLGSGNAKNREQARAILQEQYWPAVYAQLRAHGLAREKAADVTQEFFTEVVNGRQLFERADPARGRLRALILTALDRFAIDQGRRAKARGGSKSLSLDALEREDARLGEMDSGANGSAFDRRWAMGLLAEALRRCEQHYRRGGRDGHWELFERRELKPILGDDKQPLLADCFETTGFHSPRQAGSALQEVRRRLQIVMREVVAETIGDDESVEAELDEIRRFLGASR